MSITPTWPSLSDLCRCRVEVEKDTIVCCPCVCCSSVEDDVLPITPPTLIQPPRAFTPPLLPPPLPPKIPSSKRGLVRKTPSHMSL